MKRMLKAENPKLTDTNPKLGGRAFNFHLSTSNFLECAGS